MRFDSCGPNIPDSLLLRSDSGRVVFLCGAGVSLPSGMPSFIDLTKYVIDYFDPPEQSEIMSSFQPWINNPSSSNVPLDQIFNLLNLEYGKDAVNAIVTERLVATAKADRVGYEHGLIKKISSSPNGIPQIVTTNFDLLFEIDDIIDTHVPPAFPDLAFGASIEGITYLHGRLTNKEAESHQYVLSSADFGRAYLSEAWATNFVRHLLERYTVVLVGYQAEDPPIKYLLQGLNHDGQYDRTRLFAFDQGKPEEIEAKWRDRGVTAIAYPDHANLWQTLKAWAERAENPRAWRTSVIEMTEKDPKTLDAHQRGQVAHVLRTIQGAKLFEQAKPPAHPEWICVFDANIRSAKVVRGYGESTEIFDPQIAYGLDDDKKHITDEDFQRGLTNDNILVWRNEDENPNEAHRLGGLQAAGHVAMPPRLVHLISWIGKNINSPVLAWWTIRQNGIHPRLLQHIEWQLVQLDNLNIKARNIWNLVIEHHREPRNIQWNGDWFELKRRISIESWTPSVLRAFRRICSPRVKIEPPYNLSGSRPPNPNWENVTLRELGQFEVKFLDRHGEVFEVPDDMLAQVFGEIQQGMMATSGLLTEVDTVYFNTPTCYPKREVDGDEQHTDDEEMMTLLVELFDRLAEHAPEIALGHVLTWPKEDKYFFRKLRLYALSKPTLFSSNELAKRLLTLNQSDFWDTDVCRELLFLLVDRWNEFAENEKASIGKRILAGPDKADFWSDEDYPRIRDESAARYARYMELQGCSLVKAQGTHLVEIITSIDRWNDAWATSIVIKNCTTVGWVGTDETPDTVLDAPVNEVVTRVKEGSKREFGSFTEKRPFIGLVKAKPRKALLALSIAAKENNYPSDLWSALINNIPNEISKRIKYVFLTRLTLLPQLIVKEMRYDLGRWIKVNLLSIITFDNDLGWTVFDHIVDSLLKEGPEATTSSIGDVRRGREVIQQSRRTYSHAINGPLGMCAEALFSAVPGEKQEAGSLLPKHIKTRLEQLFATVGEGSDHAISVTTRKLNWLMHVDPQWVEDRLIPILNFKHTAAEASWNGFLHSRNVPSSTLACLIKPLLLDLIPWIYQQQWDRDLSKVASQWLGFMSIFRSEQADGLTKKEMRKMLRSMSDDTRNDFIFWLGKVGQKNDDGWHKLIVPFINHVWPLERTFRTESSTKSWIGLLDDTGMSFPATYRTVKKFLVPMETEQHPFYRFTREYDAQTPLSAQFPEDVLDLVNVVTPNSSTRSSYDLPKILTVIIETDPELASDHRYLRLIDLVERS
jgi:hypothetical protein